MSLYYCLAVLGVSGLRVSKHPGKGVLQRPLQLQSARAVRATIRQSSSRVLEVAASKKLSSADVAALHRQVLRSKDSKQLKTSGINTWIHELLSKNPGKPSALHAA